MHYYYITGTSSGIGRALANELLLQPDTYVVGLGRTPGPRHERYEHILFDLATPLQPHQLPFVPLPDALSIGLINNAGLLGPARVGTQDWETLRRVFGVNIVAPAMLMDAFVRAYQAVAVPKVVLNVSSGAGRHAVDAWAAYCATKAALDAYSQVAELEQRGREYPIRFFSVAPGVVDTPMQAEIRQLAPSDFSDWQRFAHYHQQGLLATPEQVAHRLCGICRYPDRYSEVLLDLRTLQP